MKKNIKILFILLLSIFIIGCRKDSNQGETQETLPATEETGDELSTDESNEDNEETEETAVDESTTEETKENGQSQGSGDSKVYGKATEYISFESNTKYHFIGEGNEYATFDVYVDYVSDDTIQFRTNNGGSELIEVVKKNNDNLTRNLFRGEVYYRENLTSKEDVDKDIILKDPVKKGTTWALPEGGNRTITDVEVSVSTPIGNYDTIEVTTSGNDGETKEYYAKDLGLVKREFIQEGFRITSTLSSIDKDVSHVQTVRFYYPDKNLENIVYDDKQVSFKTNDLTKLLLEKEYKSITKENASPVLPQNAKILSLYLNKDGAVYIDFSKELITEMNAGTGYESLIIQSIANTFGNYYGTNKVYLTIENMPYESGHLLFKPGEKIEVNMDNVVD